jgi:hypothetical protein
MGRSIANPRWIAPNEIRCASPRRRERDAALLPVCGTPYPEQSDELGCTVCILRRGLEPGAEEDPGLTGYGPSHPDEGRFDHYEIMRRNDGAFEELGGGAMGITYKAFDVDLRIPVTLKVINEKYVV